MPAKKDEQKNKPPEPAPDIFTPFLERQQKNRAWLWLAVIGFVVIIGAAWCWSIYARLSLTNWSASPENGLLKRTSDDWKNIFSAEKTPDVKSLIEQEQLREMIRQGLLKQQTASSTENTVASSTTSTIVTTTTKK